MNLFLTIAGDDDPNGAADRFEVWLQNEDHSDADRLGWIQAEGTGQIDDVSPMWRIQYADRTWCSIHAATAAAAIEFLRIANAI